MWLAAVRDVAILLLALESLVLGVLLAIMLIQLRKLVRLLRDDIAPILDLANETAHTVHGTTDIVSRTVVGPLVKISSYTAGTRQALRSLFVIARKLKSSSATDAGDGANADDSTESGDI